MGMMRKKKEMGNMMENMMKKLTEAMCPAVEPVEEENQSPITVLSIAEEKDGKTALIEKALDGFCNSNRLLRRALKKKGGKKGGDKGGKKEQTREEKEKMMQEKKEHMQAFLDSQQDVCETSLEDLVSAYKKELMAMMEQKKLDSLGITAEELEQMKKDKEDKMKQMAADMVVKILEDDIKLATKACNLVDGEAKDELVEELMKEVGEAMRKAMHKEKKEKMKEEQLANLSEEGKAAIEQKMKEKEAAMEKM